MLWFHRITSTINFMYSLPFSQTYLYRKPYLQQPWAFYAMPNIFNNHTKHLFSWSNVLVHSIRATQRAFIISSNFLPLVNNELQNAVGFEWHVLFGSSVCLPSFTIVRPAHCQSPMPFRLKTHWFHANPQQFTLIMTPAGTSRNTSPEVRVSRLIKLNATRRLRTPLSL